MHLLRALILFSDLKNIILIQVSFIILQIIDRQIILLSS